MTAMHENLLSAEEVLLVTGSQNANENDRYLDREQIRPVQLIIDNEVIPVPYFNEIGEFGVSSFAWDKENDGTIYFSAGETPYKLKLEEKLCQSLGISGLKDVHEIELINNELWMSNTGFDEAVSINLQEQDVSQRISLKMLLENNDIDFDYTIDQKDISVVEKFHCNQITTDYNDQLIALVHHTSGTQIIRKVANKLIKNQGNGGVINLITGEYCDLKLKSPHSIRKITGNYWVFDSGNSRIHIYDKNWKLVKKIDTRGFGRGSDVLNDIVCVGISETRKRYLNLINSGEKVPNLIQFFSSSTGESLGEIVIPNIEQINNVYTIKRSMAVKLLNLH
jgi:hypothetical protein